MNGADITINAINYVENHIYEPISCADVAQSVHVSMFHFHRIFSTWAGIPLGEYIRKRRLSLAGQELTKSTSQVTAVAFKYGYETLESFSKAFTKFHGTSPGQAKKGKEIKLFDKLELASHTFSSEIVTAPIAYHIQKRSRMKVLVCQRSFTPESGELGIPRFWEEYCQNGCYHVVPPEVGICAQNMCQTREYLYGIGCFVEQLQRIPEGFQLIEIPEFTWAVFKCVGPTPHAIQHMWDRIYREWFPNDNYELISSYDIEKYYPGNNQSDDYVSEIWFPVQEISK